jgi:hypothetical protein
MVSKGLFGTRRKLSHTAQVYRLFATLEDQTSHHAPSVQRWLEQAADASPDAVWFCKQTGHIYESWSGIALPHGASTPSNGVTR